MDYHCPSPDVNAKLVPLVRAGYTEVAFKGSKAQARVVVGSGYESIEIVVDGQGMSRTTWAQSVLGRSVSGQELETMTFTNADHEIVSVSGIKRRHEREWRARNSPISPLSQSYKSPKEEPKHDYLSEIDTLRAKLAAEQMKSTLLQEKLDNTLLLLEKERRASSAAKQQKERLVKVMASELALLAMESTGKDDRK